MSEVLARFEQRKRLYAPDKECSYFSAMSFHIWPCKFVQGYYKPLSRQSGKCIFSEKRNFAWSDMTLTLDLQTSSKVSAHPLSKDTLSEISAKLDQGERRTDRWAERRKDRLINIERLQREALTIFIIFFISAGNRFPTIQIYK